MVCFIDEMKIVLFAQLIMTSDGTTPETKLNPRRIISPASIISPVSGRGKLVKNTGIFGIIPIYSLDKPYIFLIKESLAQKLPIYEQHLSKVKVKLEYGRVE